MSKTQILYCYNAFSSFVKKDFEILEGHFDLIPHEIGKMTKTNLIWKLVCQFFFVINNLKSADMILIQGAGYQSFVPSLLGKFFRKKVFIIIIGTDAARFPQIGYGNFSKQPLSFITAASLRWAHHLLPVHSSLIMSEYLYTQEGAPKQGYLQFVPLLQTPSTTVLNGYDSNKWQADGILKNQKRIVTAVSSFTNDSIVQLKGLDLLIELARELKKYEFQIIGLTKNELPLDLPSNVRCIGKVSHEDIRGYYAQSRFYFQLSMSEGFPNAICEAMLCECVPIGSAVNAIPEIIGDTGFVLKSKSIKLLKGLVEQAECSDLNAMGSAARERIKENYPKSLRSEQLIAALDQH